MNWGLFDIAAKVLEKSELRNDSLENELKSLSQTIDAIAQKLDIGESLNVADKLAAIEEAVDHFTRWQN